MDNNQDSKKQPKIVIYQDHSTLYDRNGNAHTFTEGRQSYEAKDRYQKIIDTLSENYLESIYESIKPNMFSNNDFLPDEYKINLKNLVNSITSEVGRAIVGLTINQLTIKSIMPSQNIRLHKGNTRKNSFSWSEGISMRTIDANYVTPFLRKHKLLNLNKYGVFMTRSLAENYPYSPLYKAELRGDKMDWIELIDAIENNEVNAKTALKYLLVLLKNKSDEFVALANEAHNAAVNFSSKNDFSKIESLIINFVNNSSYKARIFEVAMHSLLQAFQDNKILEGTLSPMTQMRSANKKHNNVGDIEIYNDGALIESWDAKYGKEYLRDELEELNDKIKNRSDIELAGFVTDKKPTLDNEIAERVQEIESNDNVTVKILSFHDWINLQINDKNISKYQLNQIGKDWIIDLTDSLGQKRRKIAPIDEPADKWLVELLDTFKQSL